MFPSRGLSPIGRAVGCKHAADHIHIRQRATADLFAIRGALLGDSTSSSRTTIM